MNTRLGTKHTYTAKELTDVLYEHYRVDKKTGMVVQVFGWDNRGDNENLREMLYDGIGVKLKQVREATMKTTFKLDDLVGTFWKTKSIKAAIKAATAEQTQLDEYIKTLVVLQQRIHEALDVPSAERSHIVWQSDVSPALLEECRRYITVSFLDKKRVYTLKTPLVRWNDEDNVYRVEKDFTISEWRVGISGYANDVVGQNVVGLELHYLVHNLKKDQTYHQAYIDPETGNITRSWNTYRGGGEYVKGGELYYADPKDAVVAARKGIAELNRKNRETVKAATKLLKAVEAAA